jgi:hypothetical protein
MMLKFGKLCVVTKVCVFWWRVVHGILPIIQGRSRKHVINRKFVGGGSGRWVRGRLYGKRRGGGGDLSLSLFDHVDGVERAVGILVLVALRLWQLLDRGLET